MRDLALDLAGIARFTRILDTGPGDTAEEDHRDGIERIAAGLGPLVALRPADRVLRERTTALLHAIPGEESRSLKAARQALAAAQASLLDRASQYEAGGEAAYGRFWCVGPSTIVLAHAHLCAADAEMRRETSNEVTRMALAQIRLSARLAAAIPHDRLRDDVLLYLDAAAIAGLLVHCDVDYSPVQGRIHAARESLICAFSEDERLKTTRTGKRLLG